MPFVPGATRVTWRAWLAVVRDGVLDACPVEVDANGVVTSVVTGFGVAGDLQTLQRMGAEVVVETDDLHNPSWTRVLWRKGAPRLTDAAIRCIVCKRPCSEHTLEENQACHARWMGVER